MLIQEARRQLLKLRAYLPWLRARHRRESMVGPLGHWEGLRAYQLNALTQHGLLPGHRLLDIGCGPLQGGIAFIQYLNPHGYTGLDLDSRKLSEAYRQIGDTGNAPRNPRLVFSRGFGADELGNETFDFIWASQVLYYFDGEILKQLFGQVVRRLGKGGRFLGDILGTCEPEFRTRRHLEWMASVQPHSVESLHAIASPLGLRVRSLGVIGQFGYPPALNLRSNILVEVSRTADATHASGGQPSQH
jgi:SAM-dependent methyltransferase